VKGRVNNRKYDWKTDRTVRGEAFFRAHGDRDRKPLAAVPERELRVVYARITEGNKSTEWVVVFVRAGGGRARVVGVDSVPGPPPAK
jgi:hypothetical protein